MFSTAATAERAAAVTPAESAAEAQ